MSDPYTDRLSDYLDDELSEAERRALETHLRSCAACAATLDELRRVVVRASALAGEDAAAPSPGEDLWLGIAERIQPRPRAIPIGRAAGSGRRRATFSMAQLAAACLVAAVLSGAAVWFAGSAGPRQSGELIPGSASTEGPAEPAAASHPAASTAAVEDLRRALASGRDDLDPETVRTLEESLMVIEIAIREARRALDADPRNPYVRAHLDETMRRKVELLHRATMLASAPR